MLLGYLFLTKAAKDLDRALTLRVLDEEGVPLLVLDQRHDRISFELSTLVSIGLKLKLTFLNYFICYLSLCVENDNVT